VLSGHGHDPVVVQPLPGLWAAQAGTAVSVRLRAHAPNSLFTLEPQHPDLGQAPLLHITRWDYSARQGEFMPVQKQALQTWPSSRP
jgi:hypothetical protein